MLLEAELIMEIEVELGETQDVGKNYRGHLRLIPITGGKFFGERVKGEVLSGGYDWNTAINENIAHAFAKYTLQTDDGVYISIENEGFIDSREKNNVIITTPRFHVAEDKYDWLNTGVIVGSLEAGKTEKPSVSIKIFKMK